MDSTLSTINYMFTYMPAPGPTTTKPPSIKATPTPNAIPTESSLPAYAQETKTDNTFPAAQKILKNEPPKPPGNTVDEKSINKVNETTQQALGGQVQNATGPVAAQPALAQQWLANYIKNAENGEGENGKAGIDTQALPKVGQKLAQMLAEAKPSKPTTTAAQPANQTQNKPSTPIEQQQPELNTTSTTAPKTPTDNNPLPASDKTPTATKVPAQKNTQESTPGTKQVIANKPTTADDSQNTLAQNGKESILKPTNNTNNAGEKPVIAQSNTELSPTQNKSIVSKQNSPNSQENSSTDTEKPTDNETNTSQIFSESSNNSVKTQQTNQENPSADSILQKLNTQNVQVNTSQTKQRNDSTTDNNFNSNFEQPLPQNNIQTPATEQTSSPAQFIAKTTDSTPPENTTKNINEQILESIHSSLRQGDQEITIRLNPPELGKVTIKFQQTDDQITGTLEVSKTQTRAEIQQALPQLIQDLQDSGIQIKRLDVSLTDQSQPQTLKEQLLQDGSTDQQTSSDTNNNGNTNANQWMTNTNGYWDAAEPQEMSITENSINILI